MLCDTCLGSMDSFFGGKRFRISCQKNSLSLTASFRFHYEGFVALVVDLGQEFGKVLRKHIRCWKEGILLGVRILEAHQVASEHVFLGQIIHSRKVIGSLERLHWFEKASSDGEIEPGNVPGAVGSFRQVVFKHKFTFFTNHVVMGVFGIHDHAVLAISYLFGVLLFTRVEFLIAGRVPVGVVGDVGRILRTTVKIWITFLVIHCGSNIIVNVRSYLSFACRFSLLLSWCWLYDWLFDRRVNCCVLSYSRIWSTHHCPFPHRSQTCIPLWTAHFQRAVSCRVTVRIVFIFCKLRKGELCRTFELGTSVGWYLHCCWSTSSIWS